MNLPFLKKKTIEKEYFLTLAVTPYKIGAILFERGDKILSILAFQETTLDREVDELTKEELMRASDLVVSGLDMSLPPDTKLQRTVFALPYDWVEEGKVKAERLALLKELCEGLDLIPMGFLVPIEAIVAYLQAEEGAPLSAVVVEHSKNAVIAYVIRAGIILEVKRGFMEGSVLTQKVEELLGKITKVDVLPSKIILQDADGIETLHQQFLSYHWTQRLPFLHVPQVTILPKGIENEAIVNGVSMQLGIEVIPKVDIVTPGAVFSEEIKTESQDDKQSQFTRFDPKNEAVDLGFYKDQDVGEIEPDPVVNESKPLLKPETLYNEKEDSYPEETQNRTNSLGILTRMRALIPKKLSFSIPTKLFGSSRLLIPAVSIILLLIVFVFLYYNVILAATVTVVSDQRAVNDQVAVTMSSEASTSGQDKTLKLYTTNIEVSGDGTIETTGEEETGNKAAGTVTLYNKTEQRKTFDKGTTLTGSNNLGFVLTEDVNIASTSAFSTSYSNVKAKAEAAKFGKEYNLPSNTNFTISNLPSSNFFGKNDEAFTGGTKEVIEVVSGKDMIALTDKISKSLTEKAKSEASSKVEKDSKLLPEFLTSEFTQKTFDKKVGERAKNLKLAAKISYTLGYYKNSDLNKFVEDYAQGQIPDTYLLKKDGSVFTLKDIKLEKNGKTATATLVIKAVYIPTIDQDAIVKNIKGKTNVSAIKQIQAIEGVQNVAVTYRNALSFMPNMLPFNNKNITVSISNEN